MGYCLAPWANRFSPSPRADLHGVCGSVAVVQIGILAKDLLKRRRPIGWLVEIQLVAVGDHLHPELHGRVNRRIACSRQQLRSCSATTLLNFRRD
jgi:hypothetical protein